MTDLCLTCPLPDCDDESPLCPLQIARLAADRPSRTLRWVLGQRERRIQAAFAVVRREMACQSRRLDYNVAVDETSRGGYG